MMESISSPSNFYRFRSHYSIMPSIEDIAFGMSQGKELLVVVDVPFSEVHVSREIKCPWCHSKVMKKIKTDEDHTVDIVYHCTCCAVGKRGFRLTEVGQVYAIEQLET